MPRLPLPIPRPGRVTATAAWVVLLLGVAASLGGALGWRHLKHQDTAARFDRAVTQSEDAVRTELRRYAEALSSTRATVLATGPVDATAFARYVGALDLARRYPSADGFALVRRTRTPLRGDAYVAQRVAPEHAWVSARYDLAGSVPLREALDAARDSGAPWLSERFTPFADAGLPAADKHDGFTLVLPVYAGSATPATAAARRAGLRGWVAAHFRGDRFLAGVLRATRLDVRLEVFDGPDPATAKRLTGSALDSPLATGSGALARTMPLTVYGRRWTLRAQALPRFSSPTEHREPWLVLVAGLLVTASLFALLWTLSHQKARVERLVDVTTRGLRESEGRFRSLAASSPIGIFHGDAAGNVVWVNQRLVEITGQQPDEALGDGWRTLVHPDDQPLLRSGIASMAGGGELSQQYRVRTPGGEERWVHARIAPFDAGTGRRGGLVGSLEDITERKAFEAELERRALHDALTGLPNRVLFGDRLSMALARAARTDQQVGVLFVDLDRFKVINDSLGHGAGDGLLVDVTGRLQRAVRLSDTVARFGGDEFTVLCDELADGRGAVEVAERILAALAEPFALEGEDVHVSASIGIALAEGAPVTPEALIRDADAAMYRAKERGKGRFELFDEGLRESARAHLDTEAGLRRALEQGEFRLLYQPEVSLDDGRIEAVEALVRWERPGVGLVPPIAFIPLAEETGLIVPIGAWVLRQACRQAAEWQRTWPGGRPPVVAVNLAARQLMDPETVPLVARTLQETGLDPGRLCLEITESTLMGDAETSEVTLRALRALGVSLAVDDFGTGYSSLSYLQRFPVDLLKIDRSFVMHLGDNDEEAAIIEAIASMGHALGQRIVAEGVETAQQRDLVTALGCDLGQGYLWSRPDDPAAVMALAVAERRAV